MKYIEIPIQALWQAHPTEDENMIQVQYGAKTYRIEDQTTNLAVDVETGERVILTVEEPLALLSV